MDRGAEPQLLTVEQVATRLQVTPTTIRRWLHAGTLRGIRLSKRAGWRIERAELDRFLAERGSDAPDES